MRSRCQNPQKCPKPHTICRTKGWTEKVAIVTGAGDREVLRKRREFTR